MISVREARYISANALTICIKGRRNGHGREARNALVTPCPSYRFPPELECYADLLSFVWIGSELDGFIYLLEAELVSHQGGEIVLT